MKITKSHKWVYLQPSGLHEEETEGRPMTVSDLLNPHQKESPKECDLPLSTLLIRDECWIKHSQSLSDLYMVSTRLKVRAKDVCYFSYLCFH